MEFNFFIGKEFSVDFEGFLLIQGTKLTSSFAQSTLSNYNKKYAESPMIDKTEKMAEILNRMGEASAKAQDLKAVITCYHKVYSSDVKVFIKVEDNLVLGFLKTGKKNLFHRDYVGAVKQITPLCVLDFYVHESMQRTGIGKQIFEKMLECENKKPTQLAYDRPSPKLLAFLKKHYNLVNFIPQNNNFVIYQQFFETNIRSNSDSFNVQKVNFPESKFALKNNVTSPYQKREDFSKLGKQLIEKTPSNNEISKLKETYTPKKNDPLNENLSHKPETTSFAKGNQNSLYYSKKEELQLTDIQNKISQTEKELSEVQNKLSNMQFGINQPLAKQNKEANPVILNSENKGNSYNIKTPWATNHFVNMNTTSNSYGNHYYQKYYNK